MKGKFTKKLLWVAFTVAMIVCAMVVTTSAATTSDGFEYSVSGGEVTITGYTGSATEVVIPETIKGYPVTSIGGHAFEYCTSLTTITIPEGVASLGYRAFSGCTSLTSITIPEGVTSISSYTFFNCKSLKSVAIPEGVTSIGEYTFAYCESFKSITIPEGVTSIGEHTFAYCKSLKSVTIPEGVTSIGKYTFFCCASLTSITIPEGVTSIGDSAFWSCESLESITIPKSVTWIGDDAFEYCYDGLATIYYGGSPQMWGDVSIVDYYYSDLRDANVIFAKEDVDGYVPKKLVYTITNGKVTITDYNGIASNLVIPATIKGCPVTDIGDRAFADITFADYTRLTSVTIPEGVTSIGNGAFFCRESLKSITIPESIKSIGDSAFYKCTSLKSITIPDSITSIGEDAFEECKSLESITIPEGVKSIEKGVFSDCTSLTSVTIPESVKRIGNMAFYKCTSLKSITIPEGVTRIGEYAFQYCESLTNITIPESVTWIERSVFSGCTSLTSVTIPESVTSIEYASFYGCTNLTSITIPESVTRIEESAFSGCTSLTTVYYCGSSQMWEQISIYSYNTCLTNANISNHNYDNACDTGCNICGASRAVTHKWTKATCTAAKTCTLCKVKSGKVLGHNYKTTTTKATLTKNGSIVKKCTRCANVASNTAIKYAKTFTLSATSYTFDGKVKAPTVTVKDTAGKVLKNGTDYSVTYAAGRKNAGTYKVTITMKGNYSGTKVLTFKINPVNISKCTVKLGATSYVYNGKAKSPAVTVKDSAGKVLKKGTDYTVKYASGCKNVGTYKVTITFKGTYSGTKTLTFKINPQKITLGKVTGGKNTLTIAWTPKTAQATGYEIQYSLKKNFKSAKKVTVKSNKTKTTTIKKLTKGKTYYVRIRAYKTVNGKKLYSAWSAIKSAKIK